MQYFYIYFFSKHLQTLCQIMFIFIFCIGDPKICGLSGLNLGLKSELPIPSEGMKASVFHGIFEFPTCRPQVIFSWVKGGLLAYTHTGLSMSMCWWDLIVYFLSVRFIFYVSFNGSCQQENRPRTTHLLVDLSFGKKLRF